MVDKRQPLQKIRCGWCTQDPLYAQYHDEEWGVPKHDDRQLFEMLILEGAQAGLSWLTILKKRNNYHRALDGFNTQRIARYGPRQMNRLLNDPGLVRNRLKIASIVNNARCFLAVQEAYGSFDAFIWRFVDFAPLQNAWTTLSEIPAQTAASIAMSKELKQRGFSFVGPTICYALMQSVGMVNDHITDCYRHAQVQRLV